MSNGEARKSRNANMELLRMISMLMVTTLHALGKTDLLASFGSSLSLNGWIAWTLEALSICAVNVFMLISGYFLIESRFQWKRLAEIVFQTVFYSAGVFLIFWFTGNLASDEKNLYHALHGILPIHMNLYWFITAYVGLYLLLPMITAGVKALSEKQLRIMILALLTYECLFKSLLPVVLEEDAKGYSTFWYLIVFLVGAYFRRYGFRFLTTSFRGLATYVLSCVLMLAEAFALGLIHERTGHGKEILEISFHYNHLFVFLAAVGIFAMFLHARSIQGAAGRAICLTSPYALGVYLFQENLTLRDRWQDWFGLNGALELPTLSFVGKILVAVLLMFVIGICVDFLRSLLFRAVTSIGGAFTGKSRAAGEKK